MATVDKEQPVETDRARGDGGPRWGLWFTTAATVLGILLAGGSLLRDYFGWERHPDPGSTTPAGANVTPGSGGTTAAPTGTPVAGTSAPAPASVHVDSLQLKAGAANLVPLPRSLKGLPGLDRAITVRCPENTAQDQQRAVTYELLRRHQDLTLGIQAYSPDDPRAKVRVTVYVAVKRPDDSVDRLRRGSADAQQGVPGSLTADVAGADDLILEVTCELPTSVVVLADARVTPA
ncbi:hypothetical protein ONA70_34265 [Micromonospora yasonensis]|uniref:hypothetical protein n=1 Tax=Micromonospora yasonensis TaxID=1128667 RepID=UPI00222F842E|nr:hypothetical protein [Micromonospora yasonensis]MCW3845145.1 hypothetical protein [Micromonospora yasonensis]